MNDALKIYNKIMNQMNMIEYGFKNQFGNNIISDTKKWENEFSSFYYLLTPDELQEKKCGVCWDQVELERELFEQEKIKCDTFFIYIDDKNKMPSHTFLTFKFMNRYYWFEHAWDDHKGIHEYSNMNELFLDLKNKFINSYSNVINKKFYVYIYKYNKPKYHISCIEFYKFIETQKLLKCFKIQ